MRIPILCLILLGLPGGRADGSDFTALLDRDTITVGDRVRLQLEIRAPTGGALAGVPDVPFPPGLKVLEREPPESEERPEGPRVRLTFHLTAFRTGAFVIPAATATIVRSPGDTVAAASTPVHLFVRSVRPEGLDEIRDVKGPVPIPSPVPWWVWAAAAGLAGLVVLVFVVLKRRHRVPPETAAPDPVDWFGRVRALKASGLAEKGDFAALYTGLSEGFRRFLEERAGIEAMERTTTEIGDDLSSMDPTRHRAAAVRTFLNEADLVKFAKVLPGRDRALSDVDRALDLMTRIDSDCQAFEGRQARESAVTPARPGAAPP